MGRGHVELAHAHELPFEPFEPAGWPAAAEIKLLSSDPECGALTGIVELPAGYRRGMGFHECVSEMFILEGSLRIGDVSLDFGHYEYSPAGTTQAPWTTSGGCCFMAGKCCRNSPARRTGTGLTVMMPPCTRPDAR